MSKPRDIITAEEAKYLLELPLKPGESPMSRIAAIEALLWYEDEEQDSEND